MNPGLKAEGARQAEHRVLNVVRGFDTSTRTELMQHHGRQAREHELRRQGAEQALEAVRELLRNYAGCE